MHQDEDGAYAEGTDIAKIINHKRKTPRTGEFFLQTFMCLHRSTASSESVPR